MGDTTRSIKADKRKKTQIKTKRKTKKKKKKAMVQKTEKVAQGVRKLRVRTAESREPREGA